MNRNVHNRKLWGLLRLGQPMHGAAVPIDDGRYLIESFRCPSAKPKGKIAFDRFELRQFEGIPHIEQVSWNAVHFRKSDLQQLQFVGCRVDNCVFEVCDCRGWRLWTTEISNSVFRSCDVRRSVLGGSEDAGVNSFRRVTFERCDLRQTVHFGSKFVDCEFLNCRLDAVDFRGSRFTDCVFRGILESVEFHRSAGPASKLPVNEMNGVDFTESELHSVDFRQVNLERVKFPSDATHVVIDDEASVVLDGMITELSQIGGVAAKVLIADLEHVRTNLGSGRSRAVLNKADIEAFAGVEGLRLFETVLKKVHRMRARE